MISRTLHLDSDFLPTIEGNTNEDISFEAFTFSGGEPHIKILSNLETCKQVTITHRIKQFNDVGLLLLAVDALQRMGVQTINLVLPYFPGARQDRLMTTGEPLTAKVYAHIINQMNLNSVIIYDAHSDVVPALLHHCININNHSFIQEVVKGLPNDLVLISPDGGALKKIYKLASHLKSYEVVECSKTRDVRTGKLSGFKVYTDDLQNRPCLIVDDICDGGGTFLGLAKELKAKNAGKLYLAVSHGIFSKGTQALTDVFEKVYTTDSFYDTPYEEQQESRIKQYKLSF